MNRVEFFRTKPLDRILYDTLTFYHPQIGTHRFVAGQQEDKRFWPGGYEHTFKAHAFIVEEPVLGGKGEVEMTIQLGAVGLYSDAFIEAITNKRQQLTVLHSQYFSDDITQSAYDFSMDVSSVTKQGRAVVVKASQTPASAKAVSVIYKPDIFVGLRGAL